MKTKKILVFVLLLSLCFTLISCSGQQSEAPETEPVNGPGEDDPGTNGQGNPVVPYSSLEEINQIAGVHLMHVPAMGVSDEAYYVIDNTIASYTFNFGGYEYTFRGSAKTDNDVSGIYIDSKEAFPKYDEKYAVNRDAECIASRFILDGKQYTLTVHDNGAMKTEEFELLVAEMKSVILSDLSSSAYTDLCGDYSDSYSKRASGRIELADKDQLQIRITWGSSAFMTDIWNIFPTLEEKKLTYTAENIVHTRVENGVTTTIEDSVAGYFEITDEGILWTGSGVENTEKIVLVHD